MVTFVDNYVSTAGDTSPAFFILGRLWPLPYLAASFGFGTWAKPSASDPGVSVNSVLFPLRPALAKNSLCREHQRRSMRESEIQIGNSDRR